MPAQTFTQTQGHSRTAAPQSLKSSWKKEFLLAGEMALSTQLGDLSLVPQIRIRMEAENQLQSAVLWPQWVSWGP